jgi:hypothetical protein
LISQSDRFATKALKSLFCKDFSLLVSRSAKADHSLLWVAKRAAKVKTLNIPAIYLCSGFTFHFFSGLRDFTFTMN